MSRAAKKDKKGQSSSGLEQQFQKQRRQLLDCQFSIKKLEQRLNDLTEQNIRLRKNIDETGQNYNDTIEELTIKNMANEKRLLGLSNQKTKLQIQNEQKQNRIKMLQKNLFDEQQGRIKDNEEAKKNFHFQLAKYESQLSEYKFYMNEKDELDQERQELRERIQIQKANKLREIADKEREKVQATDKIKDEMNHKIKEMEKNLVSLKRQQLETTTRLTMLQNHQLTSELQYQSKQTEKLIFKNEELEQKVTSLKQQLQIHKEVEDELAKRSHFSKGVIRKLNIRINELESEVQKLKNELCLPSNIQGASRQNQLSQVSNKATLNQTSLQLSNQTNKRLINSLQQELDRSEKKYVELLNNFESLLKEKESLESKLSTIDQKANQLYKLMSRYYDEVLLKNPAFNHQNRNDEDFLKQNSPPYDFNLKHLRDTPIQNWRTEDVTLTVQILLNIIQPYMVRSNLLVPAVRKNIIISDGLTQKRSDSSVKSLPKLATERKEGHQAKVQSIPINIASKIVGSNLRDWGQTVRLNKMGLTRKYKVAQSFRN